MAGRLTDDRLERLVEAADGAAIAVKTHRPPDLLTTGTLFRFLESGQLSIHVVYRDPRDTVLSILDHGARSRARGQGPLSQIEDLEGAIELLAKDVGKLRRWGAFPALALLATSNRALSR